MFRWSGWNNTFAAVVVGGILLFSSDSAKTVPTVCSLALLCEWIRWNRKWNHYLCAYFLWLVNGGIFEMATTNDNPVDSELHKTKNEWLDSHLRVAPNSRADSISK